MKVEWSPAAMDDQTSGTAAGRRDSRTQDKLTSNQSQQVAMLTRTPDLVMHLFGVGGYPNVHIRDEAVEFMPAMLYCRTAKPLRLYNNGSADAMVRLSFPMHARYVPTR